MKDQIMRLYNEGMTKADIARSLNISRVTVTRHTPLIEKEPVSKRKIQELYQSGLTHKNIAIQCGVSMSTVSRYLRDEPKRKQTRSRATNPEPITKHKGNDKEIKELWLSGKTFTQICRELKIGFDTVRKAVIQMGIENAERSTRHGEKFKNIDRPPVYKRLWIPDRRLWIETYSEEEYNEKCEKYNIQS